MTAIWTRPAPRSRPRFLMPPFSLQSWRPSWPAPESAHAIRCAIDEALKCKETGEEKTILFGLTGTGYFDMAAYTQYLEHSMTDYVPSDGDLQASFDTLPKIPGIQD